jgi:hypothetical protein
MIVSMKKVGFNIYQFWQPEASGEVPSATFCKIAAAGALTVNMRIVRGFSGVIRITPLSIWPMDERLIFSGNLPMIKFIFLLFVTMLISGCSSGSNFSVCDTTPAPDVPTQGCGGSGCGAGSSLKTVSGGSAVEGIVVGAVEYIGCKLGAS